MSKEHLRKIRGTVVEPRPKPKAVVSGNQITGGPIYMPIRAGDPDTEIVFLADNKGVMVPTLRVRLVQLTMDSRGRGTAQFEDLSRFASGLRCIHAYSLAGICSLCGDNKNPPLCEHRTIVSSQSGAVETCEDCGETIRDSP